MNKQANDFINSIDNKNTKRVAKLFIKLYEMDYSEITLVELEHIILSMKPNSVKSITTMCNMLLAYAKHIQNDNMIHMVKDIDRRALWLRAKPMASKKFISNNDFNRVCEDIIEHEEHNALYQKTLFACIYNGVYSDDMSVLKNLKASDIHGNIVTIRDDNENEHQLEVPQELADDLKRLSEDNVWWRNNRYGAFKVGIKGLHKDSCFKVEDRSGTSEYQGRFSYYRVLRKISKEYVGYSLLPLQLYVSGMMHRIDIALDKNGYTLEDAFADNNKDRLINKIISDELIRTGYNIEVRNFREMVKGHIDVFGN